MTQIELRSSHHSIADPSLFRGTRKEGPGMPALITSIDKRRLVGLLELGRSVEEPSASLLERKIELAHIVAAATMPPTVITMNSRVLCRDLITRRERELSLVYPCSCGPEHGHVSILSATGVDLLAAVPGDSIRYALSTWHVIDVVYQPEAEGHYHL